METYCTPLLFVTVVILAIAGIREAFALVTPPDPLADKVSKTHFRQHVFVRRLKTIWQLLYETRWIVGAIITIPVIYCFIRIHEVKPEDAIKITGVTLQVFGLLLVFYQLVNLRQTFNKSSYFDLFVDWLKRMERALHIGKPRHHTESITEAISLSCSLVDGELKYVLKLDESLSVQDQVKYLTKVVKNYDDIYEQRFKKIREQIGAVNESVNQLANSERKSKEELAKTIETVSIGDHALELLGVFWLIVGVVFSTIPDSIHNLFV